MLSSAISNRLLVVFFAIVLFVGCKQPETIIVNEDPTAIANDTTAANTADNNEAVFRNLLIGDDQPIYSLDPLFVDNATSMRAIQLIYEGLVRLDVKGDVVPGMAENWNISDDSLRYTFTLRPDIYYQDSEVFSTGTGRRLKAEDVKEVFRRMAKAEVPPTAAQLFMNIRGFEPYYREQRLVYNPEKRNIKDIAGIQVPNDQTVIFHLDKRDTNFLKKLATPQAVIYPKEALGETVTDFTPVGTGPFNFSNQPTDSTYIFSKFENYYAPSQVKLNRVDIMICSTESSLFQAMSTDDLHLIPQLGPQSLNSILNQNGELAQVYEERYKLSNTGGNTIYTLRHNPHSGVSAQQAQDIAQLLVADSISYFHSLPEEYISSLTTDTSSSSVDATLLDNTIYTVYSEDSFVRTFLGSFSKTLSTYGTSLKMIRHGAPTNKTGLFFTQSHPLISDKRWDGYPALFQFSVEQLALQRSEIEGLQFNPYPWWFNLRDVTLPASENM